MTTLASRLRGSGPVGVLAVVVIVLTGNVIGALLAVLWVHLSNTDWRRLGFVHPASWPRTIAISIVAGVLFKLVMKSIVMPLLGADPLNAAYHGLVGNTAALPGILATVIIAGGLAEELIWRGFLFERSREWFGQRTVVTVATVLVTSILFGLEHYHDQRLAGTEQAVITGLAFGTTYAVTGKIWPVVIAHAAFDVAAVLIIYYGLEQSAAHLVFR